MRYAIMMTMMRTMRMTLRIVSVTLIRMVDYIRYSKIYISIFYFL